MHSDGHSHRNVCVCVLYKTQRGKYQEVDCVVKVKVNISSVQLKQGT